MPKPDIEWQQAGEELHAALVVSPYWLAPGDVLISLCGLHAELRREDFPRRPPRTPLCSTCRRHVNDVRRAS